MTPPDQVLAIIPARYGSTRLPGKPLLCETGRSLIHHVVDAARRATRLGQVIVATDDGRIVEAVRAFGGEVVLTRADHPSGTDRVAEVASRLEHGKIIVNLQGDEPEVSPASLDQVVSILEDDPEAGMATLCTPIREEAIYRDPSCVKVVRSSQGRALYFSRSPIPCYRDGLPSSTAPLLAYLHLGIYAYRRDFLFRLSSFPPSPLEQAERLEQLRVLEAGFPIAVGVTEESSLGIDTAADYRRFVARWQAAQNTSPDPT
jgi:3-deoxy-manno-octulosonate cytidylyltransferase (CMP-KDO synthetase)